MNITEYENNGRRLMVEFECRRCDKKALRPLKECMKEEKEGYRGLYDLRPPKEWQDGGFYYPLFCPDCKKAYDDFMNNKNVKEGAE